MSLKIDPEFQALIPPLSDGQRADLETALVSAGRAIDPIRHWRGIVVDGHNRLEICERLSLPYDTQSLDLPDRAAVKDWMLRYQRGRRNLSKDQLIALAIANGQEPPRGTSLSDIEHVKTAIAAGKVDRLISGRDTLQLYRMRAARERKAKEPKPSPSAKVEIIDPVTRRAEDKAAARLRAEHKSLADEVARLREVIAFREQLAAAPLPPITRREFNSGMREATAVALLSDTHVEERVLITDTPTGNAYNLDISDLRLQRYFAGVEWMIQHHRSAFQIRDLILWFGGDMMSGHIHEENLETSAMSPIATLLWIQPRLLDGIRRLLDNLQLDQIQLVCSYGNHGRDTHKSRRATGAHHSYEWGMYQQIAELLKNETRVKVLADPSGHQYTKAYEFDMHFHHGDEASYGGGVGGITIPLNKAVAQWDRARRAHYHHFGHFHQYIDTGNMVVNGSLIGYNAYAMSIKASPEQPQQAFYLIDSKRGKTCKSPIWVGDRSEELKLLQGAA
jgi:hypothetical protein